MVSSIQLLILILSVFSSMLCAFIVDNNSTSLPIPIGIDPVRPSNVILLRHKDVAVSKTTALQAVVAPSRAPSVSPSSAKPSAISTRPSVIAPTKQPRATPSTIPSVNPSNPSLNPSTSPSGPTFSPSISPSFRGGSLCAVKSTNPILYRNNAYNQIMTGTVPIYIIWYGNWTVFKRSIITDFYGNLTNSDWIKILTTYYQANGQRPSASVALSNQVTDLYSQGSLLQNPTSTTAIIENQINSGALPDDPTGIYMIISSADVSAAVGSSSSCTHFCGFHSYYTRANGKKLKFSWVGDAGACMNTCGSQDWGPNGDGGIDSSISVLAHELAEIITDPLLKSWNDASGQEIADKCAWNYGSIYQAPNGAWANMQLGSRNYLVQNLWINDNNQCCMTGYSKL